jgi:hypothetical protein
MWCEPSQGVGMVLSRRVGLKHYARAVSGAAARRRKINLSEFAASLHRLVNDE